MLIVLRYISYICTLLVCPGIKDIRFVDKRRSVLINWSHFWPWRFYRWHSGTTASAFLRRCYRQTTASRLRHRSKCSLVILKSELPVPLAVLPARATASSVCWFNRQCTRRLPPASANFSQASGTFWELPVLLQRCHRWVYRQELFSGGTASLWR